MMPANNCKLFLIKLNHFIVRMNESGLQGSINRYSKKRKSYDVMKSSSIKNGKKSLPEVFIDLNNHTKKTKLSLEDKTRQRQQGRFYGQISNFNESKGERGKKIVKKDHILLKNLYNTEIVKKNDENKNTLNEYRDEIELLKMDNERLREENDKLKANQEYLQRRSREEKSEKTKEVDDLKLLQLTLEEKLMSYQSKIKGLYEQLIKLKKEKYGPKLQQRSDFQDQIVLTTLNSENNRARTKGQIRSYREQQQKYSSYEVQVEKYKRLTSPSSHSRDKNEKNLARWGEEQRQYLRRHEERGEMAYYRAEKVRESGRNSMLECFRD